MSEVVNQLLAEGLQRRRASRTKRKLSLPAFELGRPRVNLADRDALESAMES